MNYLRAMSASLAYFNFTSLEVSKATVPFNLIVQLLIISIRDFQEQTYLIVQDLGPVIVVIPLLLPIKKTQKRPHVWHPPTLTGGTFA